MFCPNCRADMKYVKGGVGKNPPYKPYSAFWSCPNCKHTENIEEAPAPPVPAYPAPVQPVIKIPVEQPPRALGVEFTEHNLNRRAALDKAVQVVVPLIGIGDVSPKSSEIALQVTEMAQIFAQFIEGIEPEPE